MDATEQIEEWVMENGSPWTKYRFLKDLKDRKLDDPDLELLRTMMLEDPRIIDILSRQEPEGGWVDDILYQSSQYQGDVISLLSVFADFGLDARDERIARACEFALSFQTEEGNFHMNRVDRGTFICMAADTTRSLAALGMLEDDRIQRAYQYMVDTQRLDGGWIHSKSAQRGKRREHIPSCPHATLNVLWALGENPEIREGQVSRDASEVVLGHWSERTRPYGWGIGTTWQKVKYPFKWYGLLKFATILSRFEFLGGDRRLGEVMDLLLKKRDEEGRLTSESVYKYWNNFSFGQKKQPSPWITVMALIAEKNWRENS
jgi:hypothetical protein